MPTQPKVILISLDGNTYSLVKNYIDHNELDPTKGLGLLQSKGVFLPNTTITPSLTAPSHIAIATGSTAANNDINANTFHLIDSPFNSNISGFGAPIGGYDALNPDGPRESSNPTAEPLWLELRASGKKVVAATFPGADGVDVKVPGLTNSPIIQSKDERTVDYTIPFGAFGGLSAKGFSLNAANFTLDPTQAINGLNQLGVKNYSPVKVANLETIPGQTLIGGSSKASYNLQVAAIDTTNDSITNYDTLVFFDANQGIVRASSLPSTGSAFVKASDQKSSQFFFEGSTNKVGTAFYTTTLAPDLSTVNLIRYSANYIPRPAESPGVIANVDDINNNIGFWADQADFRIPERLDPSFNIFSDAELEAAYEDQVKTFVDYQARVLVRSIQQNPNADLVLGYIEQPDGSEHQFLITDPRQATDFTNPNSILGGQDQAKIKRYQDYTLAAYQAANDAVQKVIDAVGVDSNGRPNSNIIVVSDHGFAPFHTAVSINNILKNSGDPNLSDSTKVRAVSSGPAVNIYINLKGREPNGTVEPADYLAIQDKLVQLLKGYQDTNTNYAPDGAAAIFDKVYSRPVPANPTAADIIKASSEFIGQDTGDVFALLSLGYNFDGTQSTPVIRLGDNPVANPVLSVPNFYGAHGYDPNLPQMQAIFAAAGPDFDPRLITQTSVRNIDIAPTIEKILGTQPASTVQGQAIAGVKTPSLNVYNFANLPKIGTTTTGQDIFLGGFSGLYFQGTAENGNLKFVTLTDRGPNGDNSASGGKIFPLPNFQPEIVSFELNRTTGEITITKRTGLFAQDGTTKLTGLPNLQAGATGKAYTDEVAVDLNNQLLANDPLGADLEGIVVAPNGDYWTVDEYRPAIYHFDSNGKLVDRFIPVGDATDSSKNGGTFYGTPVLPAVYAQRRANRGFEGVALQGVKLYAFIQSPLDNPDDSGDTVSKSSNNIRIVEFDTVTQKVTGEYLYLLDDYKTADKIGDAVSLGNGKFAVVERDAKSDRTSQKLIYQIDLTKATNINDPANYTLPAGKTIEQLTAAELKAAGIVTATKSLIVNAAELGYTGVEKLEGLALVSPNTLAIINDNDFNITGSTNNANGTTTINFSPTRVPEILGIIDLPKPLDVVPTVLPTVETSPGLFNDPTLPTSQRADADDPAIYINAENSAKSIVLATAKNSGLRVYDLSGNLLQEINPGGIRYNNIDLQYGFQLGGQSVDIAVASDRQNDKLAIFLINPNGNGSGKYLQDITDKNAATLFEELPFAAPYSPSTRSAYGLALYRSPITNDYYVFANRRATGDVAQFKLIDKGNGQIGYERVREFTLPSPTDPTRSPQTEGTVVDQELGYLYIAQEDVGIWKFQAEPDGGKTGKLIDKVRFEGGTHLTDDAEGLTIYYGKDGTGYLLASSQGDSTFVAYTREGNNDYIGNFSVGKNGSIDSVQESDGADVINVPLGPDFPYGLFVTQDGYNEPTKIVDGANVNTNFKFVPWENIANVFPTALAIDTTSYDPRHPVNRTNVSSINGIASGDTTQDSTVLWARSIVAGAVKFEYSTDANFSVIVGTKNATVTNINQPVKVDVQGLQAGTDYYYRVTDAAGATSTGKFSTAAAPGTHAGLTFGVSGDWRGELAPYPAISNADQRNLKFFIEFGDTIYADFPSPGLKNPDGTEKTQAITLEDYRAKNAEVYSQRYGQNTWGDLRASTSILATIDDHEVVNDFAGGEDLAKASAADKALFGAASGLVNDSPLYENGLQAFQEYNPIRDEFYGQTGDARTDGERKLYRYNTYGSDAATFVLDARSFRNAELPGVANTNDPAQVGEFLAKSYDPTRTLLGRSQVEDLKRDLLKSEKDGQTWKFIMIPEPIQNLGVVGASDRFEGYAAERTEILKFIDDNKINNVVFVSADIHGTLVNNLTYQLAPGQAQIATSAFEITTGSVAFDAPFGQTVAQLASAVGLLTPAQQQFYNSLPIANDKDSIVNDKDDFIKQIVNSGLNPLGYDPVGLNDNLPQANGLINANLLQGDYIAAHTFGWTEFNIDQQTQKLTVTTYGVDAYTREELEANPNAVANRQPKVVSQFEVTPTLKTTAVPEISTTLDLRNVTKPLTAEFVVNREAAFDNFVGFYQVVDKNGGIDINGDGKADLLPGQAGYTQAAVGNRIPGIDLFVNNQGTATYTGTFKPGAIFAPFLITDGRPDAVFDTNPNNDPSVYFPFLGANTDKSEHVRLLGNNVLGFEDLPFGGDKDFNDITVKVNLSIV